MSELRSAKWEAERMQQNYGRWKQASPASSPNRKARSRLYATSAELNLSTNHGLVNDFLSPNPMSQPSLLLRELGASFLLVFGHMMAAQHRSATILAAAYAIIHYLVCQVWYGTSGNPYIVLVNQLVFSHSLPSYYLPSRWLAQFAGASLAGYVANTLLPTTTLALTLPNQSSTSFQLFVIEAIVCGVYAYAHTLLYRTGDQNEPPPVASVSGSAELTLSSWLFISIILLTDVTDLSLNLWRSLVPALFNGVYNNLGIYVLGSLTGYVTGAMLGGYYITLIENGTPNGNPSATG
jgi:hypothetical protein